MQIYDIMNRKYWFYYIKIKILTKILKGIDIFIIKLYYKNKKYRNRFLEDDNFIETKHEKE